MSGIELGFDLLIGTACGEGTEADRDDRRLSDEDDLAFDFGLSFRNPLIEIGLEGAETGCGKATHAATTTTASARASGSR